MRLPTYFISHGGGPWPYLSGPMLHAHTALAASLRDMPRQLGVQPLAVLMISAHWEARDFTVMAHPRPPMLYDYGGFPADTYKVRYDAAGSPALAARVQALVSASGAPCRSDEGRGFDHGAFVPMHVIYPAANVPLVQISLKHGCDPLTHIALGRALAPLRDEGVLIIGSGLSFHNPGLRGASAQGPSRSFDDWLGNAVLDTSPAMRAQHLSRWADAPHARDAHPTEEHLLPLMVALGAAAHDEPATRCYHEQAFFGAAVVSSFRFG